MSSAVSLTRKDFQTDQEVRWCPGCGDYAILATVQKFMPSLGVPRENICVVSGIGCSSRFPYYMNTYGFHTIHGRAPAIATGVKVANPELSVWVVTGDGDGLSIGAGHFLHALRRNVDLKILLFNNRIYGLTKGQYSPTSSVGTRTKSTPMGSVDAPLNPLLTALGANASFVARSIDKDAKHLAEVLERAAQHKGTCVIEILQNCPVFNDAVWEPVVDKSVAPNTQIRLQQGQPIRFGPEGKRGLRLNPQTCSVEVVEVGEGGVSPSELLVHDERSTGALPHLLAGLEHPEFPIALGVIRALERPVYEEQVLAQIQSARGGKGPATMRELLESGETWRV